MRGREHPTYLLPLAGSLLVYIAGRGDFVLPIVVFVALAAGYLIRGPGWFRGRWIVGGAIAIAIFPAYLYQQQMLDPGVSLYIFSSQLLATAAVLAAFAIIFLWYMAPHKLRGPALLVMSFALAVLSGNRLDRPWYLPVVGVYFLCLVVHFYVEKRRAGEKSRSYSVRDAAIEYLAYGLFIAMSVGSTLVLIGAVTKSERPMMFLAAEAVRLYEGGSSIRFEGVMRLGALTGMENSDEPVLSLKGEGPLGNYLRCQVFDSYKKGSWKEGGKTKPAPEAGKAPLVIDDKREPRWNYLVSLVVGMGSVLPSPEGLVRVESSFPVQYDNATSLISVPRGVSPRQYTVKGDVKPLAAGPEESIKEALAMPDDLRAALEPKSRELTEGLSTTSEKVRAVKKYFSSYNYSLEPRISSRTDPVEDFVFDRKEGYCRDFASGSVMLLRATGVPARMVTGFIIREVSKQDKDIWIVRRRDSHAWSEYFDSDKNAWISFDPTPLDAMNDTLDIKSASFSTHLLDRVRILARLGADTIREIELRDVVAYITPVNVAIFIGAMAALIFVMVLINRRGSLGKKIKAAAPAIGGKKADFKAPGKVTESYLKFLIALQEMGVAAAETDTGSEILAHVRDSKIDGAGFYNSCSEYIGLYNSIRFRRTSGQEIEEALSRLDGIIEGLNREL